MYVSRQSARYLATYHHRTMMMDQNLPALPPDDPITDPGMPQPPSTPPQTPQPPDLPDPYPVSDPIPGEPTPQPVRDPQPTEPGEVPPRIFCDTPPERKGLTYEA